MNKKKKRWYGFLSIGIIYYVLIRYTSFGIPCLFYKMTHLRCPGCGITHMFYEISLLHWQRAMKANYFLFFTSPFIGIIVVHEIIRGKNAKKNKKAWNVAATVYLAALMIWFIVRNRLKL